MHLETKKRDPDLGTTRVGDLRACPWWRPRTVALVGGTPHTAPGAAAFISELLDAFRAHGHTVVDAPTGHEHILLAFAETPDRKTPLPDRIPERELPLAVSLIREHGLARRPENLVVFTAVPERISELDHMEAVMAGRVAMARFGAPKAVFLSTRDGTIAEATYCTLEGGHPSDTERIAANVRDRLVAAACAEEVSERYEVVNDALPEGMWNETRTPEALISTGRQMDELNLLPPPQRVSEYVSPRLARMYERLLGIKGFSEGMLFAYDPRLQAMLVTASGSWNVDKRALQRDEIAVVTGVRDGKLQVLAPERVRPKGPSVEALEMWAILSEVPRVRVRPEEDTFVVDPGGPLEVPIVRAGIHVHVGVTDTDPEVVETVPANRERYPFGFGCGTDLMCEVARDAAARSQAVNDPDDLRRFVRWPMLYHGDTVLELWKPGTPPGPPLEGLLDLYRSGAIAYTPDHIDQPV